MSAASLYRLARATTFVRSIQSSRPICRCFSSTPSIFAGPRVKSQKEKAQAIKAKQKKKKNVFYKTEPVKEMPQFSLCDAIRHFRAAEVGRIPTKVKYEAHVKLKTKRTGPVIRQNQLRLPHPVATEVKFVVICPVDSKAYKDAKAAGAVLVGEEEIFDKLIDGSVKFDRCIAHPSSMSKLGKAGLPRVLGPKGLMPNVKNGTVTPDPKELMDNMVGGALYRERFGVVRMIVGTLGHTPEMLRDNLKTFIERIKEEGAKLGEDAPKDIHEVVLSSSNGPGITLDGTFRSEGSPSVAALSVA